MCLLSSAVKTCDLRRTDVGHNGTSRRDHAVIALPNGIIREQAEGEALLQAYSAPGN